MAKAKKKPTLEELRQYQAEYEASAKRRHGKARAIFESEEDEYRQLYNNWSSRESRKRKRELEKYQEEAYRSYWGIAADDADEYGITPKQERQYRGCFRSGYIGEPVYREYVKRMSGLTLYQIYIMQQRTGLIPVPQVTATEAKADEKRRYDTGDIY